MCATASGSPLARTVEDSAPLGQGPGPARRAVAPRLLMARPALCPPLARTGLPGPAQGARLNRPMGAEGPAGGGGGRLCSPCSAAKATSPTHAPHARTHEEMRARTQHMHRRRRHHHHNHNHNHNSIGDPPQEAYP